MEININTFSVRDSLGNIDLGATEAKFLTALNKWSSEMTVDLSAVRKAVSDVFDANPGKNLSTDYVMAQVCLALKAEGSDEFKATGERVKAILKLAPYVKTVGAKGGVRRKEEAVTAPSDTVSDVTPAAAPKKAGKSAKKASKVKAVTN